MHFWRSKSTLDSLKCFQYFNNNLGGNRRWVPQWKSTIHLNGHTTQGGLLSKLSKNQTKCLPAARFSWKVTRLSFFIYLKSVVSACAYWLCLKPKKQWSRYFSIYRVFSCRQSSRFTIMEEAFVLSITIMKDIFC